MFVSDAYPTYYSYIFLTYKIVIIITFRNEYEMGESSLMKKKMKIRSMLRSLS